MIRHKFLPAIIAAAALTLGACGGTSGTPTAQDSSSTSSEASSEASSATSETSAAADESTAADAATESAADATTTVGDGTLDAQTAQWFTTACTGMQPMGDMLATVLGVGMSMAMATDTAAAGASSAADMQKQLSGALAGAGESMTKTEGELASTPPPSFDKGEEIAAAFGAFLKSTGAKLSEVAKKVAAAPVTDTASLQAAMAEIESLGSQDMDGADLLGQYDLDPATQKAIEELPACKKMQDSLGGLLGAGSTTEG